MPKSKVALITGVTGQDGSYLAEFLLSRGYRVIGTVRRSSSFNTSRIDHIIRENTPDQFNWVRADMTDLASLVYALKQVNPDEVYNLAAQSHVKVSFEMPVYTYDVCALGVLRLLEAIRLSGGTPKVYQAGSSEMFGRSPSPQDETTAFSPASPYAVAKVAAHQICLNYRAAYGMFVANGILFNHESPRRGETFITRKTTRAVARMLLGVQGELIVGNVDSKRDWGYAPEYVKMMWSMLQRREAEDYVISTGESHSVKEFIDLAFAEVGVTLRWMGSGQNSKALVKELRSTVHGKAKLEVGDVVVRASEEYYRPVDPDDLLGNANKARRILRWQPRVKFDGLVKKMVEADIKQASLLLEGTRKHNEEWREYVV